MMRAVGSVATDSSNVSQKSTTSNLVHFFRQFGLLNRISSLLHSPYGECFVIHQKGRNASIPFSIGDTSKLSFV